METWISVGFYLAFFALAGLAFYTGGKYHKRVFNVAGILILILMAALRYNTGIDYANYVAIADDLSEMGVGEFLGSGASQIYEHSLYYFIKIDNLFPFNHFVLFAIYATLVVVPFYFGLKKVCPDKLWLGMVLYMLLFFAPSLNGMRQYAAISIIFLAMSEYITSQRKNLYKVCRFVIWVLIATLIHASAIVGLVLVPFEYVTKHLFAGRKQKACVITIYGVIFTGIIIALEYLIIQNIESIPLLSKYAHYLSWSMENAPVPNLVPKIVPVLAGALAIGRLMRQDGEIRQNIFYYALSYMAFATSLIGFFVPYGYRLSEYFLVFQIPLLVNIIKTASPRQKQLMYIAILVMYGLVYFLYSAAINNSHGIIPYQLL